MGNYNVCDRCKHDSELDEQIVVTRHEAATVNAVVTSETTAELPPMETPEQEAMRLTRELRMELALTREQILEQDQNWISLEKEFGTQKMIWDSPGFASGSSAKKIKAAQAKVTEKIEFALMHRNVDPEVSEAAMIEALEVAESNIKKGRPIVNKAIQDAMTLASRWCRRQVARKEVLTWLEMLTMPGGAEVSTDELNVLLGACELSESVKQQLLFAFGKSGAIDVFGKAR
eukprot:TRINITY_DN79045_c0_g1_i1.p1 TRINITY_DN79045_c0_g1~~TRINITY_DN79045_c0_g1_i1.p1  ORF type:complete len:231 (-),score=56.81 TRINITY_DN79045_c0_g1_i1:103-795(-)